MVGPYEFRQTGGDTRCEYVLYYIFPDLDFLYFIHELTQNSVFVF
jgi:hypothetical protein